MMIITLLLLSSLSVLGFSGRLSDQYSRRRGYDQHDHNDFDPSIARDSQLHERTVVLVYHKPPNTITSHSDDNAISAAKKGPRRTVYEDIQTMQGWTAVPIIKDDNSSQNKNDISFQEATGIRSKLHAIGRLDCDTTGLLLLTNDGGLVHHVTNPGSKSSSSSSSASAVAAASSRITKTYEAVIMGHHENVCDSFEIMRIEGVDIGAKYGGMTKPVDDLRVLDHPTPKSTLVSITISEGKNRQVRRMFHSIGSGVMKLRRVKIGTLLTLEGLEEGQWRSMPDEEVKEALGWSIRRLDSKGDVFRSRSTLSSRQGRRHEDGKRTRAAGSSVSTRPSKPGRRRRGR